MDAQCPHASWELKGLGIRAERASAQMVGTQQARHARDLSHTLTARAWPKRELTRLLGLCADTSKQLSKTAIAGSCIGAILCAALATALGLLLRQRQYMRQRHHSLGSNSAELVHLSLLIA